MLDPRTGTTQFTKRWRARYDASVNAASPLMLNDGRAFFSTSYETGGLLVKLTKDGGEPIWTNDETMSNHYNTCVVSEGMLYGIDGRQESGARLRCVDPAGPKVRWTQERFGCASLLIADKMLIILTERGDLILAEANPREYRPLAQAKILTGTPVRAAPALSNGRLYVRDAGQMKCVDLRAAAK